MENQSFIKTDGGRIETGFLAEKNDCTVRALALAKGIPYSEAHSILKAAGRRDGKGLKWGQIEPVLLANGFEVERAFCLTLAQFLRRYNTGTYFLIKRGHAFTVKNGVLFDAFKVGGSSKVIFFAKVLTNSETPAILNKTQTEVLP